MEERDNTINGQPAELIWLDEPTPQAAAQNMQKLVQENKVCAVLGGSLSSNALAEEATAAKLNVPFVCNNAAATEITGKNCNRFTFRLNTPVEVQSRMLAPFALTYGKRWYFLTASYAFGRDILRSSRALLRAAGGTEVGSDEAPLNTADFGPFILKIRQAKPDVVMGGLSAGDLSTFLKQWHDLGMKGTIPFVEIGIGDPDIWAVGPDAATGTYTKLWYYKNPENSPQEQAFAAAYEIKYRKPAADKAWMGWIAARSLFDSIDAAGSTEPMPIVEALEDMENSGGQDTVQLSQVRPSDADAESRRDGEGQDHQQVGLFRLEGDAAGESRGSGDAVRDGGGDRVPDGVTAGPGTRRAIEAGGAMMRPGVNPRRRSAWRYRVRSGFAPGARSGIGAPLPLERWPSGLRRTLGKRVCVKAYPGFEIPVSPPATDYRRNVLINLTKL